MLYSFDGKAPIVGKNAFVSDLAKIIGDVIIGDNCYIGHGVIIRGDYGRIEVNAGTAVEEGVIIHAPPGQTCYIGNDVTVGHGAILHCRKINDYAVIGMGAVVSLYSEIGEWAIVAEGAIVKSNQSIPPNVVVAGNPAKFVRETSSKDKKRWNAGKQLYVDLAKKYLDVGMDVV